MDEIFKISKDKERAEDLFEMAKERLELLKLIPKDKAYKIIEEYYEIIKELLTAIMYIDGCKTLSHIKLIEYFSSNYKELDENQINSLILLVLSYHYSLKKRREFYDLIQSYVSILSFRFEQRSSTIFNGILQSQGF